MKQKTAWAEDSFQNERCDAQLLFDCTSAEENLIEIINVSWIDTVELYLMMFYNNQFSTLMIIELIFYSILCQLDADINAAG